MTLSRGDRIAQRLTADDDRAIFLLDGDCLDGIQQNVGRVMGVRILAVYGLPTGLLGYGFLIDSFGFVPAMTLGSLAGLALTAVIAVRWWREIWT